MSEEEGKPAAAAPARDPITELGERIYVEMAARLYSTGTQGKPAPKDVGKLCIKLANAFEEAYQDINAALLEAERRRTNFNMDDLDLSSVKVEKPAAPAAPAAEKK